MNLKPISFIIVLLVNCTTHLRAQTDSPATDSSANKNIITDTIATVSKVNVIKVSPSLNIIKINMLGFLLKNYQLQYERVITKKISVAIAFRAMPVTTVPFENTLFNIIDDQETEDRIRNSRIGNFAITPEVRFYLSKKGYGQGFYIAPFYRYAKFTANQISVNYDVDDGSEHSVYLSGKLTSNTGGILFGVQKALGKHITLDWWLLGPHYGSAKGNFTGIPDETLSDKEQNSLRNNIEDSNIPLVTTKATVTANSAAMQLTGPWAGLRAGICIGVRF